MSEWKKVKIGDFLTEREGRYKPDDSKISKYKRLDKIDFSGTIHISDKPTKTDMIIVHPGDLVISGINVAKGAVAVYQGNEPVYATIHYSSYTFDSSKVDLDYFKYFVKSPAFIAALQKQVKGGIKTEIKPKHLLPLEISIPDLQTQQEIVKKISLQLKKTEQLSVEIESQKNCIKQLRQNILQEAIEGKLTAVWRKQNPVQKGNPDYDAEALFEQIQKERINEKKQKELSPITDEEKPFEISEGWKWIRLGEICNKIEAGKSILCNEKIPSNDEIGIVKTGVCSFGKFKEHESKTCLSKNDWHDEYEIKRGDFLIGRANTLELVGSCVIVDSINKKLMLSDKILRIVFCNFVNHFFILYMMKSKFLRSQIEKSSTGSSPTMKNISQESIKNYVLPLPSLKEQEEIVKQVEKHLQTVTDLENQITKREQLTKTLMQSILRDAFEEK
jgi:type I restriction enzyme S subunit